MATGTPRKSTISSSPTLSYSGKKSKDEILKGTRKPIIPLISCTNENTLCFGDNLFVLRELLDNPQVGGQVDLIYIDPPYATQMVYHSRRQNFAYSDTIAGADFIEYLRERIILLREILSKHGSFYLHIDEKMLFEIKIILDEVFGPDQYRNLITRRKCNPKNFTKNTYGKNADYILFYTKSNNYTWNRPVEPLSLSSMKEYRHVEEETGRMFMKVPVHAPGVRKGETGKKWRGFTPPSGKHWQYTPAVLDEMDARGEIFWSKNGNPRRKVYYDTHEGVLVQEIWMEFKDAHNQNIKITGYPTEKNADILRRIVRTSSNPGDLILDSFAGSGTTLAVAEELGRKWIGIDNSPESFNTIVERFRSGLRPLGIYGIKRQKEKKIVRTLFDNIDPDEQFDSEPLTERKKNEVEHYSIMVLEEEYANFMSKCKLPK